MNIIAYGSLTNLPSLAKTLGREVEYGLVFIKGYERVFNAPFGKYAYLNLKKNKSTQFVAAYFTITKSEITCFDEREKGSRLVEVKPGYFAFVWSEEKCRDLPVLQSYIEVCKAGAGDLGIDFWESTKIPSQIIDDLTDPKYF